MIYKYNTRIGNYRFFAVLISIVLVNIIIVRTTESHTDPYNCGYITLNIRTRMFDPDFLYYLRSSLDKYKERNSNRISQANIKSAIETYNRKNVHHHRMIHFNASDYRRISTLYSDPGNPDTISTHDLEILFSWISHPEPRPMHDQEQIPALILDHANNNDDLNRLLLRISEDPIGRILVNNAIDKGIKFEIRSLRYYGALYSPCTDTITIDPTVLHSEFKLNFLAHELVHALNPTPGNSIYEETYAEIIAMGIQDRITNIPISCHTYVVFIDRLESPTYRNLLLDNEFEKHLISNGIHP